MAGEDHWQAPVREVFDLRGRKCGKSTETAGVEQYMLTADGEPARKYTAWRTNYEQPRLFLTPR
jgi:hypothetical protein